MAHGLTPELIRAGGRCRAVSHPPRIQPPGTAGGEGWRDGGRQGGTETAPGHPYHCQPTAQAPAGISAPSSGHAEAAQGWG